MKSNRFLISVKFEYLLFFSSLGFKPNPKPNFFEFSCMLKFKSTFDLIHIHFKKHDIFDSVLIKKRMFYLKYK
jgi:hypothetical protein